jgi:hypothetical protein
MLPAIAVSGGPFDGKHLRLLGETGEKRLGSGSDVHLRIPLRNIERVHAIVTWDAEGVSVRDAGTEAGTYLNGQKIDSPRPIADGDSIFLGPPGSKQSARLVVRLPMHPREAPPWSGGQEVKPAAAADAPSGAEEAEAVAGVEDEAFDEAAAEAPGAEAPGAEAPAAARLRPPALPRAVIVGGLTALAAVAAIHVYRTSRVPAPVLHSVLPPRVAPGQTLTLVGSGFARDAAANTVAIGDRSLEVASASETELVAVVPADFEVPGEADHRVGVTARKTRSNTLFVIVYQGPRIAAVDPEVAMPGEPILIRGEHLTGASTSVMVGGLLAEIEEARSTSLRVRVPALPPVLGRSVPVHVRVGQASAPLAALILGRPPLIVEVSPPRGLPGDRVSLRGYGFEPSPARNAVTIGGRPALVLAATATTLSAVVPGTRSASGPLTLPVAIRAFGRESTNPVSFTVARGSASRFTPRFTAEPVTEHPAHEHVFVSTELGPVLLLSDKAEAPSLAERGARVAAALNALSDSAARVPSSLMLRESPEPSVTAAGAPQLLLTPTAADLAGYQEGWGASSGGARKLTRRSLAAHWRALLQDYLALFVHGQRPTHVLETSSRGRVFMDLFAESQRRAGDSGGVPPGIVDELSPAQLKTLREIALVPPAEGETTGGAVVAGRWDGTLEEPGQAARTVQLRLRIAGVGLAGSLATRSGGLSAGVPVKDASYEKGVLRFTAILGGSARRFEGTLEGRTLAGTLRAASGSDGVGRFSLRWVE